MKQLQQGDVWAERIAEMPPDAVPTDRRVVATGELTGHAHRLLIPDTADVDVREAKGTLYLKIINGQVQLVHEEHLPVSIPLTGPEPEVWMFGQVNEWDYNAQEARRVSD